MKKIHAQKQQHVSGLPMAARIVIFILIAGLLIHTVYSALRWKDTSGNYLSSMDQLYATTENTIDVVFTGSSHCYAGVYPAVLWADRGIASFDMAVSGQDKQSSYHDLIEVLKTQHPQVVFADLYGLTFEEHGVRSNEYRNMLAMRTSRNSIGLVKDYADRADWMDYILRWPVIHTRYRELEAFDFTENPLNTFGRGGLYDWDYNAITFSTSQSEDVTPLSDTNRRWLDRMTALSEKAGFRLVFMVLPYVMGDEDRMIYNGVKEYLDAYNADVKPSAYDAGSFAGQVDLIDFTDPAVYAAAGLDGGMDFHDEGHLSGFGAVKISQYLEQYLDEEHLLDDEIPDRRGDPAWAQWDQDSAYFNQTKYTWVLPRTENLLSYCALLSQTTDLTLVLSLEGTGDQNESGSEETASPASDTTESNIAVSGFSETDNAADDSGTAGNSNSEENRSDLSRPSYATDGEWNGTSPVPSPGSINPDQDYTGVYDGYYAALSLLGMSREDYLSGGKWLYKDGQLQKIHSNNSSEEPFTMDLSNVDSLRVQYNGDFAQGNMMIGMHDYSNADGMPVHLIVYDDLTDQLLEGRSF